ncbi:MAG: DUF2437 domain-containing protein, partial [Armatimonadetes bacterium]|nr:DUF2437 domain-containing protein [Armatimonadota bacterium]
MKIARFVAQREIRWGLVDGETIRALRGAPWDGPEPTGETFALADVKLLAPVEPPDIFAIGLN